MNCSRTFATVLMHTYYKSTYCAYIRFTLVIESHIISKQHVILILPHDAKLHFIYKNKNIAHIWRFQCISLFNECTVRQLSPGQSHWTSPSMSYAPYFMSKFQSHNTTIAVEKLKLQYCFFCHVVIRGNKCATTYKEIHTISNYKAHKSIYQPHILNSLKNFT